MPRVKTVGTMECVVKGCKKLNERKDMCMIHYQRMWRTGTTVALKDQSIERRFWSYVKKHKHGSQCWSWTGQHSNGWGYFEWVPKGEAKSKKVLVHRFAYELTLGPIPPRHDVRHRVDLECESDSCCKPTHLYVTKIGVRRQSQGICKNGRHMLTPENSWAPGESPKGRRCKRCYEESEIRYRQRKKARKEREELLRRRRAA